MQTNRFGEEIDEYLKMKEKATQVTYSSAFNMFLQHYQTKHGTDKGFSDYLDRIFEELKKPRREQRRIAEIELVDFIAYLKQKGFANNTVRLYFAAVQNFLKFKGVTASASFINLPPPIEKPINHKHEWTIEQIKVFVDSAPSYRDKAVIVGLFQSGLGVHELANLNYGDIQDEYEKGIVPICLRLVRQKTDVPFKTFFGADTLNYLGLYLQTRRNLTPDSPLFTKSGSKERITTAAIQQRFSEIAEDLAFIKKKELEEGYNPCRPHSLRAAFNSQLVNKISDNLIEFWMGHSIGTVKDAYLNMPTEELRKLYMDAEKNLAIEKTSRELKEKIEVSPDLENKLIKRIEDLTKELFQKYVREQEEADREAQKDLEETRKDFIKRHRPEKISKTSPDISNAAPMTEEPILTEDEDEPLLFLGTRKE